MRDLGWGDGGGVWQHPLRAWEEEQLGKCWNLLSDFVLQPHVSDQWLWRHDLGGGYIIRGTYNLLTRRDAPEATIITLAQTGSFKGVNIGMTTTSQQVTDSR
jgi:hypothetical protein